MRVATTRERACDRTEIRLVGQRLIGKFRSDPISLVAAESILDDGQRATTAAGLPFPHSNCVPLQHLKKMFKIKLLFMLRCNDPVGIDALKDSTSLIIALRISLPNI